MKHQTEGVEWLLERNGCGLLAFEPGVGKTLTALETVRRLNAWPLLIVAPVSLLATWAEQIEVWLGVPSTIIRGTKTKRLKLIASKPEIAIIGFESFRVDKDAINKIKWRACIYDEAGKIRTPTAKVSKIARAFQPPVRIALDGTIVSNSIADLWNVTEWVAPGSMMGNWWNFRSVYAIRNPYILGKIDGWRDVEGIVRRTEPHILWKKKADVLDLPPLLESDIIVEPTPAERKFYKQIKDELRLQIEGEDTDITNALTLLLRLRQAANGVFHDATQEPTKLTALRELAESLPHGEKMIVFTQFTGVVDLIEQRLGLPILKVVGEMSAAEREQALEQFKTDPAARLLVMTSSGERGLNIQFCSYMCMYDLSWSFASHDQRIGRIYRKGQTQPCTVWSLIARGTVDEKMRKILWKKQALAEQVSRGDVEELLT